MGNEVVKVKGQNKFLLYDPTLRRYREYNRDKDGDIYAFDDKLYDENKKYKIHRYYVL